MLTNSLHSAKEFDPKDIKKDYKIPHNTGYGMLECSTNTILDSGGLRVPNKFFTLFIHVSFYFKFKFIFFSVYYNFMFASHFIHKGTLNCFCFDSYFSLELNQQSI